MHGQGNYNSQLDQTRAPLQPPYQHHVPGSFPPQTPVQPQVVPCSAVNQVPAASSRASHSAPPLYGHRMGTPPTAHNVLPLQAPVSALSSTIPTSQSFVNTLQRPLIPGSMPMPSTHWNAQQSSHHPSHAGNPIIHQILSPVAGPPWSDLSPSVRPPRLPPPPPIQGQTTYGPPVNSQAILLDAAKGVLHSIPSSSGSLVHTIPRETHVSSNASLLPPSPSLLLPLASLPPVPLSSFSVLHNSSKLQQHCESEEMTKKSHGFGVTRTDLSSDILDPTQMRSDATVIDVYKTNNDGTDRQVSSVVGSGSIVDGSLAQDISAAPPKPTEEKVIQKIEILCQFIAKNGPGFEDMACKRESRNPEFKFLFGGEPGSEAAIAHDYFQWLKRKYCSTGRLPKGDNRVPSQHSEICSLRQPERLTLAAMSDPRADSDMEMEDDITQLNEDGETRKSIQDLSCGPDFVHLKMDSKGQSHVVQDNVDDAAHENFLFDKVSFPGGATFSDQGKGGIIGKLTVLEDDDLSSSTICEHGNFGKGSAKDAKSLFRLLPENHTFDASLENNDEASHPEKHIEMITQFAAEGPINVSKNIDVDIRPEIPNKVEKSAGQMFESTRMDRAPINSSQLGTELKETNTTSSVQELNENGDESHNKGSAQAVPSRETFDQGRFRSATEYKNENSQTLKENKDHNFRSSPTAVKVDEFGRLVREGVSDSNSDDSYHASEHNRKWKNRGKGHSPRSRRRKQSGECQRRERRSLSRSWSPRRRRSRSRSPRRRRSRSRSPRRRRSRSRSLRRRGSRSRSPLRRAGEFRGDSMRLDRGRKPECFDFLRGRCYRGSSCRYSHHDAEIDGSRRKRREPKNAEMLSGIGHSNVIKETYDKSIGASGQVDDEIKKPQHSLSMHSGSFDAMEVQKVEERNDLDNVENDEQGAADQSQQETVLDQVKDLSTGIPYSTKFKKVEIHGLLSDADAMMTRGKTLDIHYPMKSPLVPFQVNGDAAVSVNPLLHPKDSASGLKPSSVKNITSSPVTSTVVINSWNFPEVLNVGSGASYFLQPAPPEDFPSATLSNIQPRLSSARPSSTLNTMPASDMSGGTAAHGGGANAAHVGYMHYHHSHVPLNTNFGSQALLKRYPSLLHSEVQRLGILSTGISTGEHFVGPSLTRAALSSSDMNLFPTGNVPPAELSRPSEVHSYVPLQNRGDTSGPDAAKEMTTTVYPQDFQDMNQPSFAPDHGGSRVTSRYNPYASTFVQPLVSRFGADILPQDYRSQYNTPQGVQDGGSEQSSSMKSAAGIQQILAQPGGDQYDPLFDSIEPSNSIKKVDHAQKQGSIYDSDVMLSMSGSNKPLDVEENNKKKGIEAFIPSTSPDDDGFGETADAEVGDVENASPSNPIDETNDMDGEVEIDRVKSPGNSKKCKESRSTKLFKIALANFVKEVLRPSWRQGSMSKEAFKTIVKKTVDKVTGAMKSHHIPNSQSKINHYIDSSQWKLTKLVMGYVDKYVKV